ncbi:SEC-C motif-containing protein [Vibrio crassostreae]|nr:DUF4238 domain-containing protein [Vibrio crassostreae]ROO49054.1 SEC-C motif-containing protein [Vibrio crassostreae]TCL22178.1 SEC-C motif-containing protein [Vibrio crassostreae]TCN97872.1 SEC-C motif-containing protein [Vibrio crassostreae]TCT42977.1 SEC-C motif-containing protein [Vibrio crassostreae]TCT52489.1 SEC-C motif-containing protein [Vibrio crassostreae]
MSERDDHICHLTRREFPLPNGELKVKTFKKWHTPAQRFYGEHLYSTFFGEEVNDDIEQKLFGPIDDNGSKAVRAFLTDDQTEWHHNFEDFFTYLDAQKLRTPKGLDWIRSKYPELSQLQLMIEMQSLRTMHCTLWAEGVRELVSAEDSDVKFIVSDHPITVYNYACPPDSDLCEYPNDPDIALKGSQTLFPLDKNRCLILTNLEYAQDPENTNPLEQRTNATRMRRSMVNTIEFINTRNLTTDDVTKINHIIKSRAKESVAAGKEDWLYPERGITCDWAELRHVLLPPENELYRYGGEVYAHFEDGTVHYQDAFGRTTPPNEYLNKDIDEAQLGRNDLCGCGSGRKYKSCCLDTPQELRTTWSVASIRERNLMFCNCIRDVLGLNRGKTWLDVRRELSDDQIKKIYGFYSTLWPRETDIYSLLPKSDGKFRGLYTGPLDARTIGISALPMASMFDEFLIETPVTNPNNVRPEFSPIESPARYKYQALKDFMFMLQLEPYIGLGLINLIPDPSEFDVPLMRAMMEMARERGNRQEILNDQDRRLHLRMSTEDLLNSTAMMPREVRIQLLISQFGLDEDAATQMIVALERAAEASPLVMLQQVELRDSGQFLMFRMGPNYEMALLIAQVTGSVLVTDSGSRWQELMVAQHRSQGIVSYPWSDAHTQFNALPIDEPFLDTFRKSQGNFSTARNWLKTTDRMVQGNNRNVAQLTLLAGQASDFTERLERQTAEPLLLDRFRISSPEGGFYDATVQRLLARSSCLRHDRSVRSVYGVGIQD